MNKEKMLKSELQQNILLIALNAPYDKVAHAGGKTCNFYVKKLLSLGHKLTIITSAEKYEEEEILFDQKKYGYDVYVCYRKKCSKIEWGLSILKRLCPLTFASGFCSKQYSLHVLNTVKTLYKYNSRPLPDRIICDWFESTALLDKLKKIFPNQHITASEHDVVFQSCFRFFKTEHNLIKKILLYFIYKNTKFFEVNTLKKCDCIKVHNKKDENLLLEQKINPSKISQISPYYDKLITKDKYTTEDKIIIFYGAMSRIENCNAVIWFLENVFFKLDDSYKFYIIGNKPNEILKKYKSDNVIITGFVEDVSIYTQKALCFVVPLLQGAGIKVKVLEGFAMGIPVLTNDIGIEGIAEKSQNKKIYMHCESPDDYIKNILLLDKDKTIAANIGKSAVQYVFSYFDYENCTY